MNDNFKVSIIMPCYNCCDFIGYAIESVISQTYRNFELIIVDDFSVDDSSQVVKKYLKDKRIFFYSNNKNLGGAVTRNIAIERASGRYIAFLDADDLWEPFKLEKQVSFMQDYQVGFSFSGYTTIREDGGVISYVKPPSKVSFNKMLKHNYIGCLTVIYDTKPFGKIFMPLIKKRQDFALWLELLKKFDFAYSLKDSLGYYRVRPNTLSGNKFQALRFYWYVLRQVANLSLPSAAAHTFLYVLIVFFKKKFPTFYNSFFIN